MNKYLIFGYHIFYPNGGMHDLIGFAGSVNEAKKMIEGEFNQYDFYQIVDPISFKTLVEGTSNEKEFRRGDVFIEFRDVSQNDLPKN